MWPICPFFHFDLYCAVFHKNNYNKYKNCFSSKNLLDVLCAGRFFSWSGWSDSNRRPPRPKRGALAN